MIDWNHDGQVDPTEVILTVMLSEEQNDDSGVIGNDTDKRPEAKVRWTETIFRRKRKA